MTNVVNFSEYKAVLDAQAEQSDEEVLAAIKEIFPMEQAANDAMPATPTLLAGLVQGLENMGIDVNEYDPELTEIYCIIQEIIDNEGDDNDTV